MNSNFKDLSWIVSEEEYRNDSALSYSTLARYEREGFNNLHKLFDRIDTPSLTFGSIVDTLITGTEEEFNSKFMIAQLEHNLSDTLITITKTLFNRYNKEYNDLKKIPDDDVLNAIEDISWNNHWLPKTRVKKIKEDCSGYYQLLYLADNRTIISSITYNKALQVVDKLKSYISTKFYFAPNSLFDKSLQRFYQLKFKATFNNVDYRCMADLIVVIHDKKLVVPVDLKTSSKPEWDFYKSFIDWSYHIQARLYWRIIRANMDKDPIFKEYTLAPYKFIVANKKTLIPLVWNYEDTEKIGTLYYGKNKQIECRDPFTIGEELHRILIEKPQIPFDITVATPNSLITHLNNI